MDDSSIEYFKTKFRGRPFRGAKVKTKDDFTVQYTKMCIHNSNAEILQTVNFKSYYVWRFDEEIHQANSLVNINHILNVLDCLS